MSKKNKKKAKKLSRKKRVVVTKATKHELVVRVESNPSPTTKDLEPEMSKGKYMLPKTWMSDQQVVQMVQKTPPQHVYTRPAKGGGTWSYITQSYVVKVLNFTFGWNWDFEIVDQGREGDQIWVKGKLVVKSPKGEEITKMQFGRADIKFKKDSKMMMDYGNDLKAASSDALKKCASLIGIGSDIYGKMEFKQEAQKEVVEEIPKLTERAEIRSVPNQPVKLKEGQVLGPNNQPVYLCSAGDEPITEAEYLFSKKMFKKALCREHQKTNGK